MKRYTYYHDREKGWIDVINGLSESDDEYSVAVDNFNVLRTAFSGTDGGKGSFAYMPKDGKIYFLHGMISNRVGYYSGAYGSSSELKSYAADGIGQLRNELVQNKGGAAGDYVPLHAAAGQQYRDYGLNHTLAKMLLACADAILSGKSVIFRLKNSADCDGFMAAVMHLFPKSFANEIAFCSATSVLSSLSGAGQWVIGYTGKGKEMGAYADEKVAVIDEDDAASYSGYKHAFIGVIEKCIDNGSDLYDLAEETWAAYRSSGFDEAAASNLVNDLYGASLSGADRVEFYYKKVADCVRANKSAEATDALRRMLYEPSSVDSREENMFSRCFVNLFSEAAVCEAVAKFIGANGGDELLAMLGRACGRDIPEDSVIEPEKQFAAFFNLFVYFSEDRDIRRAVSAKLIDISKVERNVGGTFNTECAKLISNIKNDSHRFAAIAFFSESWINPTSQANAPDAASERGTKVVSLLGKKPFDRVVGWLEVRALFRGLGIGNYDMPPKKSQKLIEALNDEEIIALCLEQYSEKLSRDKTINSDAFEKLLNSAARNSTPDNFEEFERAINYNGLFNPDTTYGYGNTNVEDARSAIQVCRHAKGIEKGYILCRSNFLIGKLNMLSQAERKRFARVYGYENVNDGIKEAEKVLADNLSEAQGADFAEVCAGKQTVANAIAANAGRAKIANFELSRVPASRWLISALIVLGCFIVAALVALAPVLWRCRSVYGMSFIGAAGSYLNIGHIIYPCLSALVYFFSQLFFLIRLQGTERSIFLGSIKNALKVWFLYTLLPGLFFDAGWAVFYFIV